MTTATVQLPVLFDVSGTATVFGESATTADFITPHLEFTLDMTTLANGISLNAANFSNAISVGDHEVSDTIYYATDLTGGSIDLLANRLATAITRGKLVHVPHGTDHSDSGIPMGGRPLVAADGTISGTASNNIYALKYRTSIAPINDEQMMGEAMARVAAVHLVGHPLAQAVFKNEGTIQSDLELASGSTFTVNGASTAFYNTFATQLSKVLGGALCSTPLASSVLDPSGQVAQAIFEGAALVDVSGTDSGVAQATYGTIVAVPDVSGNTGSTKALFTGHLAAGVGNAYAHDLSANGATTNVKSATFWCRTPSDVSMNLATSGGGVDYALAWFQSKRAPANPTYAYLSLATNGGSGGDLDRISIHQGNLTNQVIEKVVINGVDRALATSQIELNGGSARYTLLTPAVPLAELTSKWNHYYVEFKSTFIPNIAVWGNQRGNSDPPMKKLIGAYYDEIHYFDKALTTSEIAAMRTFRSSQIKANGLELPAVKSMFEQLMNIPGRALEMDSSIEVTGLGSEGARTSTVGLPLKTGDKIVVYIRPKVEFAFETVDITAQNLLGFTGSTLDVSSGNLKDISGLVTAGATASTISAVFQGRATAGQSAEADKYGWMGSPNATMIGVESTNITAVNTMDQHIWKIEITL